MKKFLLPALSLFAAASVIADPLEKMDKVHQVSADAAQDFNAAVLKELSADFILRESGSYATSTLNTALSLKTKNEEILRGLEQNKKLVENLKVAYAASGDLIKTSGANLSVLSENLPMGEALIKIGREIAVKGRELTAKNPGDNYQDQTYFQLVATRFDRAVSNFNALKDEAAGVSVKMSVSSPMMSGINSTIGMAEEYIEKLAQASAANTDAIGGVLASADGFYKNYAAAYDAMSKRAENARVVRSQIIALFTKISAVEINGFGKDAQYADVAFKYAMQLDIPKVLYPNQIQTLPNVRLKEELSYDYFGGSRPKTEKALDETAKTWGRSATQNAAVVAAVGEDMSYEKKLRGEILSLALNLDNITNRLNRAVRVIQYLVGDANDALNSISNNESSSQAILRKVIGDFGESQGLASEIQILAASIEVGKMREKISSEEVEKLFTDASALFKKSSELASQAAEQLADVKAELN